MEDHPGVDQVDFGADHGYRGEGRELRALADLSMKTRILGRTDGFQEEIENSRLTRFDVDIFHPRLEPLGDYDDDGAAGVNLFETVSAIRSRPGNKWEAKLFAG
jgi:hypothetical protein